GHRNGRSGIPGLPGGTEGRPEALGARRDERNEAMRGRPITVAGLLLATAFLAFDLAAVELVRRERSWYSGDARLLVVVLPTINALALGLYLLRRQLALRGEVAPFLVGFQAAGWPAVAAALIAELGFEHQVFLYESWAERYLAEIWHEYIMWD